MLKIRNAVATAFLAGAGLFLMGGLASASVLGQLDILDGLPIVGDLLAGLPLG